MGSSLRTQQLKNIAAAVASSCSSAADACHLLPAYVCCAQVAASKVSSGSLVLVRPGEQVPLDGDIVWGTSSVSLQHISGESLPVRLGVGAEVPAGEREGSLDEGLGFKLMGPAAERPWRLVLKLRVRSRVC